MAEILMAFVAAWVMYSITSFVAIHAKPADAKSTVPLLHQLVVRVFPIGIALGALLGLTWLIGNVPAADSGVFIGGMVAGLMLGIVGRLIAK